MLPVGTETGPGSSARSVPMTVTGGDISEDKPSQAECLMLLWSIKLVFLMYFWFPTVVFVPYYVLPPPICVCDEKVKYFFLAHLNSDVRQNQLMSF